MRGKAVPIIKLGENSNKFEIDKNALNLILSASDENCEIAVISIAGAFREGKSFLLNFFIHYLESITILGIDESSLFNDLEQKVTGFNWKRGTERETSGILIWSEIFYYTMSNGTKIGILLMDTQGIFDNNTLAHDNLTVFALSNLLASFQIFNLSKQIKKDDLQHLQLFLEYGRLALNNNENSYGKPFQQIMFLIRDWPNNKDYQYGEIGGTRYVDDKLKIEINQHEELKTLRSQIKQCFEKINGFLLPHPGNMATKGSPTGESWDGKLKDLDHKFIPGVNELLQSVIAKQNIKVKKINGRNITIKQFKHLFFSYWSVFEGDKLPQISTIFNVSFMIFYFDFN